MTPTTRSVHAQAQLRVVLRTMSATLFKRGTAVVVRLPSREATAAEAMADDAIAQPLRKLLDDLRTAVRRRGRGRTG